MDHDYCLLEYSDPKGRPFWELTSSPDNSEFQKLVRNPKSKITARKIIAQISKIYDYGLHATSGTSKLRCIDATLGLYELKGFDGVKREMIYALCEGPDKIVLLFGFRGHQGSGNIQKEIKRGMRLASIAKELMKAQV